MQDSYLILFCLCILCIYFSNLEYLENNYITTISSLVVFCFIFSVIKIVNEAKQFGDTVVSEARQFGDTVVTEAGKFGDKLLAAYSSKDTLTLARRHSAAVAIRVIDSINEEGQSGPLCWPFWLPYRCLRRTTDIVVGAENPTEMT